jgi:hypothetical protein
MLDVMHGLSYHADLEFSFGPAFGPVPVFTRGHAQLAVMMADRDGDGKLSMTEMQTLIDGSYQDDTMTPELSTA